MNFMSLAYNQTSGILLTGRLSVVWHIRVSVSNKDRGNIEWPSDTFQHMSDGHNKGTWFHEMSIYSSTHQPEYEKVLMSCWNK